MLLICIIILICAIVIAFDLACDSKHLIDTRSVCFAFVLVCFVLLCLILMYIQKPTAIDVYQGKTTLEITYKDDIPVDSVVVWKGGKK